MEFDDIFAEILEKFILKEDINLQEYYNKYPEYKEAIISKLKTAEFIKNDLRDESFNEKSLGEYVILQELGRGGMGIVLLGLHQTLSRLAAIKILPPNFSQDKESLANFVEEAKIIAKFNHPNIVPIYSINDENGIYYIAMGYIPGPSIANIIQILSKNKNPHLLKAKAIREILQTSFSDNKNILQKNIALKRDKQFWNKSYFHFIATIGSEIADALNYAHQNNIIHGDIKPSNIIFSNEGIPLLVDFGLSKDLKDLTKSKSNEFSGTLAYAAPEQLKDSITNEKTDIWSLGVTLYELLTFLNPFCENTIKKTANKITSGALIPLRNINKNIPIDLEAIILKCLEINPNNRYDSVSNLKNDLLCFLESKPIKAKPIGLIGKANKWRKRHPVLSVFIVVFLGVSLCLTMLYKYKKLNGLILSAQELQRKNHLQEAEVLYSKIINSTTPVLLITKLREQAFLGLAQIYTLENPQKSQKFYKKCLDINPNNVEAIGGMIDFYKAKKNFHEAIKWYKKLIATGFSSSTFMTDYPLLIYKVYGKNEAIKAFDMLITRYPLNEYVVSQYAQFIEIELKNIIGSLKFSAKMCKQEIIANSNLIKNKVSNQVLYLLLENQIYNVSKKDVIEFLMDKGFDKNYSLQIIEILKESNVKFTQK